MSCLLKGLGAFISYYTGIKTVLVLVLVLPALLLFLLLLLQPQQHLEQPVQQPLLPYALQNSQTILHLFV
jgi:predicted MFS family arabinose efflux permease